MFNSVERRPCRLRRVARALCASALIGIGAAGVVMDASGATGGQAAPRFGFGQAATESQIAQWDIDVRPDGHGLKPGRGTVEQGQAVYDARCASCHGTFGESNAFMVIAGGVTPEDLHTGRARGLLDATIARTLGTKLNYAITLWDYINRAMPWQAPRSLTPNEVYAVTAYVLHLSEIVPAGFELSDQNIRDVAMPNRHGMTRDHAMGSAHVKPDVQGSSCMRACSAATSIISELPPYARNAHGDLRRQMRAIGPYRAVDTTRYDRAVVSATTNATPNAASEGTGTVKETVRPADLINRNACASCHAASGRIIGPSFAEIGERYAARVDAEAYLLGKIRDGSAGIWGPTPMPAQSALREDEARLIVRWILAGAR